MDTKTVYLINLGITCLTCIFILFSCGACSEAGLDAARAIDKAVHPAIDGAGPLVVAQPWYIYVMLAADIFSSVVATLLALKRKQTTAEKVG
jgi:glycerol uptake facilitator-like aquaporin